MRKSRFYSFVTAAALAAAVAISSAAFAAAAGDAPAAGDGVKVTVNGAEYRLQSAPFVDSGTLYLPVRDLGELLGTMVSWSPSARTVTMHYPELTVKLTYGSMSADVNGRPVALSAPLRMVDGRLFAPLRFFSEAVGAAVQWEGASRTVSIARPDEFIKPDAWRAIWLSRDTGELYAAPDEQSPAQRIGRLEAELRGEVSFEGGPDRGGDGVLTIVDRYGDPVRYDAYGLLMRDNRIVVQKKASYEHRYEPNIGAFPVYDPDGWISYDVLTDGRTATLFDGGGSAVRTFDLPALAGADDAYALLAAGEDYLIVRPNRTGLLTLIDLKDGSVVALADKLLAGKELAYARSDETPYRGDALRFAGDMGYGVLHFAYEDPLAGDSGGTVRLTYERPSYAAERAALPKERSVGEMAAGCSAVTVEAVHLQDGDQLYVPLVGADAEARDGIAVACGILKKFADHGVEETMPAVFLDTFFHGMSIQFKEGDGVSMYRAGADRLALGSGEGGATLVLTDEQAAGDFERLKVRPTALEAAPNPAHFGETIRLAGNNGDYAASAPLIVTWSPILDSYSSSDPDPSLVIYEGASTFGRYDVSFAMPAYGIARDGKLRPIPPGRGRLGLSGSYDGWAGAGFIELLPARAPFLSVNGVPTADPALAPLVVEGRAYVPLRAVALLAGQPVAWDAPTGGILIRTKPEEAAPAADGGPRLWIDGRQAAAELQPIVRGGTAYVPVRAVTAAFGLPVVWDGGSRSVNVTVEDGAPEQADE